MKVNSLYITLSLNTVQCSAERSIIGHLTMSYELQSLFSIEWGDKSNVYSEMERVEEELVKILLWNFPRTENGRQWTGWDSDWVPPKYKWGIALGNLLCLNARTPDFYSGGTWFKSPIAPTTISEEILQNPESTVTI